jgi:hypothetical protein
MLMILDTTREAFQSKAVELSEAVLLAALETSILQQFITI